MGSRNPDTAGNEAKNIGERNSLSLSLSLFPNQSSSSLSRCPSLPLSLPLTSPQAKVLKLVRMNETSGQTPSNRRANVLDGKNKSTESKPSVEIFPPNHVSMSLA